MEISKKSIALLIDSENISAKYIDLIIDEANKYGSITYRRIYGDWTMEHLKPWKNISIEHGLTPIQQFTNKSGKNATDFTLIIDAMDILYKEKVDSFCIVSSDSDFTKLVTRLKEDNMFVFGMGESKTPISLVNSCENFSYLDKMYELTIKPVEQVVGNVTEAIKPSTEKKKEESSITPLKKVIAELKTIINDNLEDDGWAYWAQVHQLLGKKFPGFHPRNYGKNMKAISFFEGKKEFEFTKRNTSILVNVKKKNQKKN